MMRNDACDGLAPASFTVRKSDAVAFGGMYALAIASPIPESSTLHDLHAIFQLCGWHVLKARHVLTVVGELDFADSVIVLA